MGIFRKLFGTTPRIGNWFGGASRNDAKPGDMHVRRWEAGQTDRLNSAHWAGVTGQTVNQDLSFHLEILRTRCDFELARNPDLEGVVNTHVVDMFGADGPLLQVQSVSKDYNEKLEQLWRDWWDAPDLTGQLSGVDLLHLWGRTLWPRGEYLFQIVTDNDAPGPIKMRLHTIDPRRLATPMASAGDDTIILGVKRNKAGKPETYYIDKKSDSQFGAMPDHQPYPAKDIDHGFRVLEAGQVRGVPWLATGLQAVADLRDFDNEVLDAARAAADYGVLLETDHPDIAAAEVNETTPIERRAMRTIPPGYHMKQMTPQQPSTAYLEYHDERMRSIGRPVGMPLMMIKLDSRKHNYSSARFDDQVYRRTIDSLRGWIRRRTLDRLVRLVEREGGLESGGVLPKRPDRVKFLWNWPAAPHVDPGKEAKATTERLMNGTTTLRDECAARGFDWENVIAQRERERESLEKAKLPTTVGKMTVPAKPPATAKPPAADNKGKPNA